MVRVGSTKPSAKSETKLFLTKAAEFAKTMEMAFREGEYNSAAVLAVHCVISSCDSVTSFFLERRSSDPNHLAVLNLLSSIPKYDKNREKQIRSVISIKNDAEYQSRLIKSSEAKLALIQARRILEWARSITK